MTLINTDTALTAKTTHDITQLCSVDRWQQLITSDNPFINFQFLCALEQHGAVTEELGWLPQHLSIHDNNQLIAACTGYLTSHSFGDFVYDWNWARIAELQGVEWYPKWVIEVPYSPVNGQRLQAPSIQLKRSLIQALQQVAAQQKLTCVQINYCQEDEAKLLQQAGFIIRPSTQLHWHNHDYQSFDDFSEALTRKRRKETRRERRKVAEQGITHRWVPGVAANEDDIHFAHACYQKTFCEYGNFPALSETFFKHICALPDSQMLFCIAERGQEKLACALFMRSATHLYGRYWGALSDVDCLHFETCFYQGIEYCIEQGLQVFEPGAGGGHKLNRGFLPETIYTAHWVTDESLRVTLSQVAKEEHRMDNEQQAHIGQHSPFKVKT